ncbi:MAG TPA: hypothetical protein VMB03_24190 [Bryobacteraceae bacterium]|nr:hypothetical protein [Bryobacteraceae bacterium]
MRSGISLVLLACCAACAAHAREEVSRDFQKSVPLAPGKGLRIEHSQGSVSVHTQAKREVEIHASMKCSADRAADAHSICDGIRIFVDESGAGISVRTEFPSLSGGFHNLSWSANLDIVMPDAAPLELRNQFGTVSVADLHAPADIRDNNGKVSFTGGRGRQRIETSFGDIELARNEGDVTIVDSNGRVTASEVTGELDVRDNFGDIRISNVGKRLEIHAGNGNVTVADIAGVAAISDSFGKVTVRDTKSDVSVRNQNGDVETAGIAGAADLSTTFGAVRFSRIAKGVVVHAENAPVTGDTVDGTVTAQTTFGGIDVHAIKGGARLTGQNAPIHASDIGGEVYAKTSFAGVTVEDVGQPVTVENQNGSITVRARPSSKCQPMTLSTTFGPIKVVAPQGVGYDVMARTSFGHISLDTTTMNGEGDQSISTRIGGGGCPLKLVDQNGNIEIAH